MQAMRSDRCSRTSGSEVPTRFSMRANVSTRSAPTQLRVPASVIADALAGLEPSVRRALEVSIERARRVHQDQRRVDVETEVVPGGTVTERWLPVARVGLYVPGGAGRLSQQRGDECDPCPGGGSSLARCR